MIIQMLYFELILYNLASKFFSMSNKFLHNWLQINCEFSLSFSPRMCTYLPNTTYVHSNLVFKLYEIDKFFPINSYPNFPFEGISFPSFLLSLFLLLFLHLLNFQSVWSPSFNVHVMISSANFINFLCGFRLCK